jgi:hypothetical protein
MNSDAAFTLNIDRCINDKSRPAVIRELFKQLRDDGYINIGKYFAEISDVDLDMLADMCEHTHPEAVGDSSPEQIERSLESLMLIGLALTVGEGGILTEKSSDTSVRLAILYIVIEGLYRQGLVDVFRENWSMSADDDKPVVQIRK